MRAKGERASQRDGNSQSISGLPAKVDLAGYAGHALDEGAPLFLRGTHGDRHTHAGTNATDREGRKIAFRRLAGGDGKKGN